MTAAAARGGPQRIPRPPSSEPGDPPPWSGLAPPERVITLDRVRGVFGGRRGSSSTVETVPRARPAGVLVPLYEDGGEVHVVLTRRSNELRSHTGEVSFPGGLANTGESAVAAALREANEEIGLDPETVEIVGELDHLRTMTSRSFIVPVVGVLPGHPANLESNPAEVEAILHVPLSELLLDGVYREERWRWAEQWGGRRHPIFFFELVGDTVWGATAAMLRQFLGLALGFDVGIEHS